MKKIFLLHIYFLLPTIFFLSSFTGISQTLNPGVIAGNYTVQTGFKSKSIYSVTPASRENNTVLYQWEYSVNGGRSWLEIAGATYSNYTLYEAPEVTTLYRRKAVSSGSSLAYSNVVTITIPPFLCDWRFYDRHMYIGQDGGWIWMDVDFTCHQPNRSVDLADGDLLVYNHDGEELDFFVEGYHLGVDILPNNNMEEVHGEIFLEDMRTGQIISLEYTQDALSYPFYIGDIYGNQTMGPNTQPIPFSGGQATGGGGSIWYTWEYYVEDPNNTNSSGKWEEVSSNYDYEPQYAEYTTRYRKVAYSNSSHRVISNQVTVTNMEPPCKIYVESGTVDVAKEGGRYTWSLNSAYDGRPCINDLSGGHYRLMLGQTTLSYSYPVSSGRISIDIPANVGTSAISGYYTLKETRTNQEIKLPFNQAGPPPLTGGVISAGTYEIVYGSKPSALFNVSNPNRSDITYQWELSTDGTSWNIIPNASGASYTPSRPWETTYYRRVAVSGSDIAYSNTVTIEVPPPPCDLSVVSSIRTGWRRAWVNCSYICTTGESWEDDCDGGDTKGGFFNVTYEDGRPANFRIDEYGQLEVYFPENDEYTPLCGYLVVREERTGQEVTIDYEQSANDGLLSFYPGEICCNQTIEYVIPQYITLKESASPYGGAGCQYYYVWECSRDGVNWSPAYEMSISSTYLDREFVVRAAALFNGTTLFRRKTISGGSIAYTNSVSITKLAPPCSLYTTSSKQDFYWNGSHTLSWSLTSTGEGASCANDIRGGSYTLTSPDIDSFTYSFTGSTVSVNILSSLKGGGSIHNGKFILHEQRTNQEVELKFQYIDTLTAGKISVPPMVHPEKIVVTSVEEPTGGFEYKQYFFAIIEPTHMPMEMVTDSSSIIITNTASFSRGKIIKCFRYVHSKDFKAPTYVEFQIYPIPCNLNLKESSAFFSPEGEIYNIGLTAGGEDCSHNYWEGGKYILTSNIHGVLESYADSRGINVIIPPNTGSTWLEGQITLHEEYSGQTLHLPFEQLVANPAPLHGGLISGDQEILAGNTPSWLCAEQMATGGAGRIRYSWEYSIDSINWRAVVGANEPNYLPARPMQTTYYRRAAANVDEFEYSNVVTITVPPFPCELDVWPKQLITGGGWQELQIYFKNERYEYGCSSDLLSCFLKIEIPGFSWSLDPIEYQFIPEDELLRVRIPTIGGNPERSYIKITEERTEQELRVDFEQYGNDGANTFEPGSIRCGEATLNYGHLVIENDRLATGGQGFSHYNWEYSVDNGRYWDPVNSWRTHVYAADTLDQPSLTIYALEKNTMFRRKVVNAYRTEYSNVVSVSPHPKPCGLSLPYNSVAIPQRGGWITLNIQADGDGVNCANDIIGGYYTIQSSEHRVALKSYVDGEGLHVWLPCNTSTSQLGGTFKIKEWRTEKELELAFTQAAVYGQFTAGLIDEHLRVTKGFPNKTIGNVVNASSSTSGVGYRWEYSDDKVVWSILSAEFGASLTPAFAEHNRYYRRVALCEGMELYSNVALVEVLEALQPVDLANATAVNYTIAFTPREASTNPPSQIDASQSPTISYYDGLGRPIQTVQRGVTPRGRDMIQHQEYDTYGREWRSWLPVSNLRVKGAYTPLSQVHTRARTLYADNNAYSETRYEASPLSRPLVQFGAGQDWHGNSKGIRTAYLSNILGDAELNARYYKIDVQDNLVSNGSYSTGELLVNRLTGEDGYPSWEFKDKLGRVVLTRVKNGGGYHSTYYVYDDAGDLRYVLPPLVANDISGDRLDKYAYRYRHDHRHRCVEKKLPGVEPTYIRYDELDRPTMVQDGNLREQGWWLHTAYDALGRVTEQYLATEHGEDKRVLSQNFYDHHGFASGMLAYRPKDGFSAPYSSHKGLLTGSLVYVDSLDMGLYTAMYYDDKGRVVQSHSQNHLGGYDRSYYRYRFTGEVLEHRHEHTVDGQATLIEGYLYDYDHVGRPLRVRHYLNNRNNAVLLVQNTYDELGRLVGKNQGGVTNTGYTYNVRGWQTQASGTHLTQQLYYQRLPEGVAGTPSYGGNISAMQWRTGDNVQRGYTFTYDGLSRLTHAQYGEGSSLMQHVGRYNEQLGYDAHGNPTRITRWGVRSKLGEYEYGVIDHLQYRYDGNKMLSVVDTAENLIYYGATDFAYPEGANLVSEHYRYDANGNLIFDLNKGVTSIIYDHQNQPREVNFEVGHKMSYIYNGMGGRLRTTSITNTLASNVPLTNTDDIERSGAEYEMSVTDYVGNTVYKDKKLHMLIMGEGYVEFDTVGGHVYHYYVKDHLGNNRVVVNQHGGVVQTNHYYPFGMEFNEENQQMKNEQPYKYGGKVEQSTHRLNLYDFHARQYDPATIRFTSVDPHAESYYGWSPFAYCYNNPLKFIDPDGKDVYEIDPENGQVSFTDLIKGSNYDILFTKGGGEAVKISDKAILPNLEQTQKSGKKSMSKATTKSGDDATKLFKFAADNTNVEWGLLKTDKDGQVEYHISTYHDKDASPSSSVLGVSKEDVVANLHSHPGVDITVSEEMKSMGYGALASFGTPDWQKVRNGITTHPSLVYFPNTKRLYSVEKDSPKFFKKVNNSNQLRIDKLGKK